MTTSSRRPSPASRAARRSRRPAPRKTTFLDRYRNVLLWVGGIAVFAGLVFVGFIAPGLTPAYACVNMFEPTPPPSFVAPSAAPVASGATPAPRATAPAPGFVEPDMGRNHVTPPGTKITYTWCPPASGNHYSASGQGPIPAGFYDKDSKAVPGGWIHNLEHGYEVLLYKCPGPGCTDEGQAQLQALIARWPVTPICHTPPGLFNPVIARFDDMPYPLAAVVWDMVLPMQTLDEDQMFAFYSAYAEQFNPEKQPGCVQPTASPGAAPTTPPATPSPAPASPAGTAPAPSASTAPAAS